jgi:hypothetical protein
MATRGLDLTFDLLAHASNNAADGLLAYAMASADTKIRQRAIAATLQRRTSDGAMQVLRMWNDLNDAELRAVQDHPLAMQSAVRSVLREPVQSPLWRTALEALRLLSLDELLPLLIDRLETAGENQLEREMLATVLHLSGELGMAAREGRGRPSVREPVVRRLAESVRRLQSHRCSGLCEAFLAASCWGDRTLRHLLCEDEQAAERLADPLRRSTIPGVLHLLAGFLRRKNLPDVVRDALVTRRDWAFRDALFRAVSDGSVLMARRHFQELPLLAIFSARDTLAAHTPWLLLPGLALAHTLNSKSPIDRLSVLLDVLALGRAEHDAAVLQALQYCEELDRRQVMEAAIAIAEGPSLRTEDLRPYCWILGRTLQVIDYPNAAVSAALRRLLRGLHADQLLDRIDELPEYCWAKLGDLVCQVDEDAELTISGALRSPAIKQRVRAIKAAAACNLIGKLEAQLTTIARQDYREVRIVAMRVLSRGRGDDSLRTLASAASGPDGLQRDVARDSLNRRIDQASGGRTVSAAREEGLQ